MPSAHLCCFSKASEPPRVLVIGLQGSGKSLLVQQLLAAAAAWQPQQRSPRCCPGKRSAAVAPLPAESVSPAPLTSAPKMLPTIGTELHKFPGGIIIREVGGVMQQLWHHYYAESTAVVFVVDAACPDPAAASKHSTPCSRPAADEQQEPPAADAAEALEARSGAADAAAAAEEAAGDTTTAGEVVQQTATSADEAVASSSAVGTADSSVLTGLAPATPLQQPAGTEAADAMPPDAEVAEVAEATAAAAVQPGSRSEACSASSGTADCVCDCSNAGTSSACAPGGFQPSKRAAAPLSEVLLGLLKHSDVKGKPVCVVFNKVDLLPHTEELLCRKLLHDLPLQQWKLMDTSALTGAGLQTLLAWLMCEACVTG